MGDPERLMAKECLNTFKHLKLAKFLELKKHMFSKKFISNTIFNFMNFKILCVIMNKILILHIVFRGKQIKKAPNDNVKILSGLGKNNEIS